MEIGRAEEEYRHLDLICFKEAASQHRRGFRANARAVGTMTVIMDFEMRLLKQITLTAVEKYLHPSLIRGRGSKVLPSTRRHFVLSQKPQTAFASLPCIFRNVHI